ncbi:hypothetical protein GCM10007094_41120 [Pseudovibrio japonicus]|uniref:DUF2971 domain-containing protein n=1 Tax=Pseudovibrio japonicus TaxID=366534 RepID=A0ABQ3EQA5_9HYPH|nr:DUF2971 domain-containing protein [Pseudovibrio japonicus]GHB47605.1 hypothetical protein GCM10007094_41120 [Pseudovibrio japonicus]
MEYVYHYTTIQVLALILDNKTLRFKAAATLNDKKEGSQIIKGRNELTFISSWSKEEEESLPMWSLYGGLDGVRIGLPIEIFESNLFMKDGPTVVEEYSNGPLLRTAENLAQGKRAYYHRGVEYHQEQHRSETIGDDGNDAIWFTKDRYWAYEKEYRFLFSFPLNTSVRSRVEGDYIDVGINEELLKEIKVLVGPRNMLANKVIAEALLKQVEAKYEVETSQIPYR